MHAQILKEWFATVWRRGHLDEIAAFYTPQAIDRGALASMAENREEFRELIEAARASMKDFDFDVTPLMEAGDWLGARVDMQAVSRMTSKQVSASGVMVIRFEDGLIAEAHKAMDFLALLEDLDVLPRDTLLASLAGVQFVRPDHKLAAL